jgi:hypothetical protein
MPASGTVIVISEEYIAPVVPRYRRPARWPGRSVAIAATVLIHLLVSAPLIVGTPAHNKRSKDPQSNGSVEFSSQGEDVQPMILLDLSAISTDDHSDELVPDIDAEGILLKEAQLALATEMKMVVAEPIIDEADLADEANKEAGDPSGSAALYGKYMSHVAARIERAWMRPRSPIATGHFACRVRIAQDRDGNVQGVSFERCDADLVWRESLRNAILKSSPLSSPPEPWMFTNALKLGFTADQYERGRTPEYLYVPEARRLASTSSRGATLQSIRDSARNQGDLELEIRGSEIIWKPKDAVTTKP